VTRSRGAGRRQGGARGPGGAYRATAPASTTRWPAALGLLALTLAWLAPVLVMVAASLRPETRVLPEAGMLRGLVPLGATLENYRRNVEMLREVHPGPLTDELDAVLAEIETA